MHVIIQRVQRDGSTTGGDRLFDTTVFCCLSTVSCQYPCIARCQLHGACVRFLASCKLERTPFKRDTEGVVPVGQVRRKIDSSARITQRALARVAFRIAQLKGAVGEGQSVLGVEVNRFRVSRERFLLLLTSKRRIRNPSATQIRIECGRIACPPQFYLLGNVREQCDLECLGHGGGDLGLQFQYVTEVAVIGLRPQVKPRISFNQLGGDTYGVIRSPHAPLQHRRDVELVGHGDNVGVLFEGKR
jgi:hypothetical protein